MAGAVAAEAAAEAGKAGGRRRRRSAAGVAGVAGARGAVAHRMGGGRGLGRVLVCGSVGMELGVGGDDDVVLIFIVKRRAPFN